ncbi:hypothetical protein SKAU_G00138100 [Synaphobranchus kaupii]|uniref:Uncharacterized protein n=1 Tax=Synaphobranchus kaupii TaxID=118154 RepID=A0A9Q1FS54_SYNKA|nr:hypothetical protein SKAU_G00138100 [Synaphobranchus kaupii]
MPPLTSPPGCDACRRLTHKIAELEGRISVLHQIKDDELLLDSLIAAGPGTVARNVTGGEFDATVPWNRPNSIAVYPDAAPVQSDNRWTLQGARPKAAASSTPSRVETWSVVGRGKHGGKRSVYLPPPQDVLLENKFDILGEQDFPSLAGQSQPSLPPVQHGSQLTVARRSPPPAVRRAGPPPGSGSSPGQVGGAGASAHALGQGGGHENSGGLAAAGSIGTRDPLGRAMGVRHPAGHLDRVAELWPLVPPQGEAAGLRPLVPPWESQAAKICPSAALT